MDYQYKRELTLFLEGFKNIDQLEQTKLLNFAGIQKTSYNDFIEETEKLVEPDPQTIVDHVNDLSVEEQSSVFESCFNALDVETMNGILEGTPYRLIDKDELDEDITNAQNSLDDIKEKLNKLIGG